jgi:hypothetical protein
MSHCDKPTKFTRSECHNFGWTDNPSTLRRNVTVVNCHSRRFVGWTDSVGRNVTWSVCGWTDRQGTGTLLYRPYINYCACKCTVNSSLVYFSKVHSYLQRLPPKIVCNRKSLLLANTQNHFSYMYCIMQYNVHTT